MPDQVYNQPIKCQLSGTRIAPIHCVFLCEIWPCKKCLKTLPDYIRVSVVDTRMLLGTDTNMYNLSMIMDHPAGVFFH